MGMTAHQQQAISTPQQAFLADCRFRGIQFANIEDAAADSKLIAQDPGIAASLFEPDDNECGPVMSLDHS